MSYTVTPDDTFGVLKRVQGCRRQGVFGNVARLKEVISVLLCGKVVLV